MFLGHFAMGLAASRAEPRLRLGTAFLAAQLPDAIWPYLLLAGVERVAIEPGNTVVTPLRFEHFPWSHSLVMMVLWGSALAALAFVRKRPLQVALLLESLVVSHWALDAASHRPDVPVWPGGPVVGLGLWNSLALTLLAEMGLFALAVWLFARGRRLGWGFWLMIATLLLVYVASVFGPPPPSVPAIAASMIVAVPLLWWWGNRATAQRAR